MGDSSNNSGKVNDHGETRPVSELESENNHSANSLCETTASTYEVIQHEIDNRTSNGFPGAAVATFEHRFYENEGIACLDDDTMSGSICSGDKQSTVSFFGVPEEVIDHGESSIEDYTSTLAANVPSSSPGSFLCKAVLFRGHEDSNQLRFAWYIINGKTKHDESIGRFIEYEKDHHRSFLDGYITFLFKDYLCIMVSHQCKKNEFYPCGEDHVFNQRIFTKEYVSESSIQKFLGPIQWYFVRNPDALGLGNCEFTFTFKTSEDCKSFTRIIPTYRGQPNPEAIAFATPMTPNDRCTIQVCFACLVNQVHDIGKISRFLYQWSVLTLEEQKDFSKGNRKENVMLLLLRIQRRGNVLDFLIEALQNSEKEEVAAKTLREHREKIHRGEIKFEEPFPMPDADKKELRRRFDHLTSSIRNKKNILAEMYSSGILTDDKMENIMKKKCGREKAEEIIWAALSFGRRLSDFIAILRRTDNKHLAKTFNPQKIP